jgi:beta-glucosidase
MSDWGATASTAAAARAGLDQEMPGGGYFTPRAFDAALASGALNQSTVDDMATRVLTAMFGVGIMVGPCSKRFASGEW